jgi:hypothetical protein
MVKDKPVAARGAGDVEYISTEEYAAQNHVKAQTVRARLSRTGSYFGDIPRKLPNRLLSWPSRRSSGG